MNDRRRHFVREYVKDYNAKQAAIRAGYSEATAKAQGSRLLTYADVQAEIAKYQSKQIKTAVASYERACERMSEIMERGKDQDAIKATERLSKLRGWDQPSRVQTEDVTPPRYDLAKLSDAELEAFEALLQRVQS